MVRSKWVVWLVPAVALCGLSAHRPARSQGVRPPADVSAEELGKQFAPDTPDAGKAYRGRVIRVNGRVAMAHEPYVYLATGSNFPTGQPVRVTLDYKGVGVMPDFTAGDRVVVEGTIDRTGIFGPILTGCRVVQRDGAGEKRAGDAARAGRPWGGVSNGSGRNARKGAEKADDPGRFAPIDPHAVALKYDGPVRAGEPGYRAECTSFRLKFGPGDWRGTAVGRSVAWGDGNQNKDYWGVGSGEPTFVSEVHDGPGGAYFVFSLNGTEWESERVAALFRLTLPDGSAGLATAFIPVGKGP